MPTVIDMSVAIAAPLIPMSSTKMNMGASTTLHPAPINMVIIACLGYPVALITLLSEYMTFIISIPGSKYAIKSWA